MAFEIAIPRLGWSMEEGTFVRWLKRDGDLIKAGDAIYELEGEKSAQDIESVDSGILRIPANAPSPGSIVAVGTVIGYLVADGEHLPHEKAPAGNVATQSPAPTTEATPGSKEVEVVQASIKTAPLSSATRIIASPRAKRVAAELGIDWGKLTGTGRNGRVREQDVRNAALSGSTATPVAHRQTGAQVGQSVCADDVMNSSLQSAGGSKLGQPLSTHRRTIAARMLTSQQRTAPVTLTTRVDATNLVALRNRIKQAVGSESNPSHAIPSYNDIILKLLATVLPKHPIMAARWEEDRYTLPSSFHLGFAVDTETGLIVPVVRNVESRTLNEVAVESARLIRLARSGKLNPSEMQDGVFTITNLGSFGIDAFTPIINYPEVAVLGLGRIRPEAVVFEGQIVARDQITLSLTFDHRLVDGAPAARFLKAVSDTLETVTESVLDV